jgi:ribosome-associated protein
MMPTEFGTRFGSGRKCHEPVFPFRGLTGIEFKANVTMPLDLWPDITDDSSRRSGEQSTSAEPEVLIRFQPYHVGQTYPLRIPFFEGGPLAVTARMPHATLTGPAIQYPSHLPSALDRACLAAKIAHENKGQDVLVLDMREVTPMYDFFVIATGASKRQIHAIVEEVDEQFTKLGDRRIGLEGYDASKWVVQDYGDVMLHVFDADSRAYYQLEELWNDAEKIDWKDECEIE